MCLFAGVLQRAGRGRCCRSPSGQLSLNVSVQPPAARVVLMSTNRVCVCVCIHTVYIYTYCTGVYIYTVYSYPGVVP